METCAVHGLKYDPTQHSSCVMCRRGTAEEAVDVEAVERRKAFKLGGVGGAAIAVFAAIGVGVTLSGRPEVKAPAATPPPVRATAEAATSSAATPPPKAEPPPSLVPVASAAGQKPTMLPRMQLQQAKEHCGQLGPHAGGDYGCLVAITPFLEQLTQLPVSQAHGGPPAVHSYEMNRTGLGFDCLWFAAPELSEWREEKSKRAPKPYPYVALLVASPAARPALVSLEAKNKRLPAEVQGAPWPSDYSAYVTFDNLASPTKDGLRAKAKRYSVCMTFPDDKPTTVYAGVATWVSTGPTSKEDGGAAFRTASIEALGLNGSLAAK